MMSYNTLYVSFTSIIILGIVLTLYALSSQVTWAAFISCMVGTSTCNGTQSADVIIGSTDLATIHGMAGNDYILGFRSGNNVIYGDGGNDTMIGGNLSDYMNGGRGDDKYDGGDGDDTLEELAPVIDGLFIPSGDDNMAGGFGNDRLSAGEGKDRIYGGQGNDSISANAPGYRDFFQDFVDCGSGGDMVSDLRSSDGDIASMNCEITKYPDD